MPCVYLPGPAPAVTVANTNQCLFNHSTSRKICSGETDPFTVYCAVIEVIRT